MFDAYKVDRAELWAAMASAGVSYALVEFSGGNDEGGADRVELDGKVCTDYESPLYELLARLPHERYYSFAGDFEVHGRVMVDRAAMTVMMAGSELATPYHHAKSSVKKFGGYIGDYIAIHEWINGSKAYMGDFRHRALRHHAQGIFECAARFGDADGCIVNKNGTKVYVRLIAEQHIIEDCGYIPTLEDWFKHIQPQPWMNSPRKLSQED